MKGTYYRWTRDGDLLHADILGDDTNVIADPDSGKIVVTIPNRPLSPDEARMIGVRMIEAAALADAGRSVREN